MRRLVTQTPSADQTCTRRSAHIYVCKCRNILEMRRFNSLYLLLIHVNNHCCTVAHIMLLIVIVRNRPSVKHFAVGLF